jgi:hypothetical protein
MQIPDFPSFASGSPIKNLPLLNARKVRFPNVFCKNMESRADE